MGENMRRISVVLVAALAVIVGLAPAVAADGPWSVTEFDVLIPEDIPDPDDRNIVCSLDDGTSYTYVFTDGVFRVRSEVLTIGGATFQERIHFELIDVVGGLFVDGTVADPSLRFEGLIDFSILYDQRTGEERLARARAVVDVLNSNDEVIDSVDFIEIDNKIGGQKHSISFHDANCG
jgi:hypothetical protein